MASHTKHVDFIVSPVSFTF